VDVRQSILSYAGFSPPAPATSSLARGTSSSENGSGHFVAPVQLPGQGSGDLAPASKPFSPNHAAPNPSPFQPQTSSQVNFLRYSLLGGELISVSFHCGTTEMHFQCVCGSHFRSLWGAGTSAAVCRLSRCAHREWVFRALSPHWDSRRHTWCAENTKNGHPDCSKIPHYSLI
jgi:hypothetical protein